MSANDAAVMEASLLALGDSYDGMAAELMERLIAEHPHYAAAFINPAAAQERMARETLEALIGLAAGEPWVDVTVTSFVDLHRNYADFRIEDYARWFALTIDAMERRAGPDWPAGASDAWQRQATKLATIVGLELERDRLQP